MPPHVRSITERTVVPISLVVTFIGGVIWLSTLYAETKQNTAEVTEIKKEFRAAMNEVRTLNLLVIERLARIEERLKSK